MQYYLAILEDSGPDHAVGVWFPDLPGCFSAGDTFQDAMMNAPEALALHIEGLVDEKLPVPPPRSIKELRRDPEVAEDIRAHIVAVIPYDDGLMKQAAE